MKNEHEQTHSMVCSFSLVAPRNEHTRRGKGVLWGQSEFIETHFEQSVPQLNGHLWNDKDYTAINVIWGGKCSNRFS